MRKSQIQLEENKKLRGHLLLKKKYILLIGAAAIIIAIIGLTFADYIPILSPAVHQAVTGEKSVFVSTMAMDPTVKQGATVYYAEVPYESLQVNDIILFKNPMNPENVIISRIVKIENDGLITKGDFNDGPYPWEVNATLLVGKVTKINNP